MPTTRSSSSHVPKKLSALSPLDTSARSLRNQLLPTRSSPRKAAVKSVPPKTSLDSCSLFAQEIEWSESSDLRNLSTPFDIVAIESVSCDLLQMQSPVLADASLPSLEDFSELAGDGQSNLLEGSIPLAVLAEETFSNLLATSHPCTMDAWKDDAFSLEDVFVTAVESLPTVEAAARPALFRTPMRIKKVEFAPTKEELAASPVKQIKKNAGTSKLPVLKKRMQ